MTDEEIEVDFIEIDMNEEEIDELIEKLEELKKNKGSAQCELAQDLELTINYVND